MCFSDDLFYCCGSGFGVMGSYGISYVVMEFDGFLFGFKGYEMDMFFQYSSDDFDRGCY